MANLDTLTTTGGLSVGGNLTVTSTSALTGAVTTTGALTVGTNLAVTNVGKRLWARKSADESVTSSTTLQNDDHLALAVVANASYVMKLMIIYTSAATPGIKYGWTGPASATLSWGTSTAVISFLALSDTDNWSNTASAIHSTCYTGVLVTAGSSGTLQFQWAQNASNATAMTVKAGSYLMLTRTA